MMNKKVTSSGFTLIELLVVIAIVALLASIFVSAVGKARQRALSTKSASNMRHIATGILLYATEHQGKLPPLYKTNGGDLTYWPKIVEPYMGGTEEKVARGQHSQDFFYCPLVERHHPIGDYALNTHLAPPRWDDRSIQPKSVSLLAVSNPARIGLLFQAVSPRDIGTYDASWVLPAPVVIRAPEDYFTFRNNGRTHIVTLDGSLSSYTMDEVIENVETLLGTQQ